MALAIRKSIFRSGPKSHEVCLRPEKYINIPLDVIIRGLLVELQNEDDKLRFIDFYRRFVLCQS